eukprot:2104045-Pyramimonas_sp.AAC.1
MAQGACGDCHPFWHSPHTVCGPTGSSSEGHSGTGRMRGLPPTYFGTPLRRFVAPQGAPPKAPMARAACGDRHPFWHTPYA